MNSTATGKEGKRKGPQIGTRKERIIRGVVGSGNTVDCYEGPACRTRNHGKRKLGPINYHPVSDDDDDVASSAQSLKEPIGPAGSVVPEKHALELVLDILQRRDTYELFGEPEKEEEVKSYYEQVKEPMDFGTMRAKLHEGMYTNLDQFEGDVFLITENAMQFNAKSTIFFSQARAIHKLAKQVFHLLGSDPKGFESRVSKTRHAGGWLERWIRQTRNRRSWRTTTAGRTVNLVTPFCSSRLTSSGSPSPKHRRRVRKKAPSRVEVQARDGRRPNSSDPDRRSSYKPWTSFLNNSGSVPISLRVQQHDIGYRESLMTFCKDLGPTAQKVALRKLQALQSTEAPSSICNPILVPNLSSEALSCSHQIPEEPSCQTCMYPVASEKLTAIVPLSRPPIPADRPSRVTVLGLKSAKAGSSNRNTGEKPKGELGVEARAKASADPLPLTVYGCADIDHNRRATATFDAWPQLSLKAVIMADARPFSFDLQYLKAKLEEMNRDKGWQIVANK